MRPAAIWLVGGMVGLLAVFAIYVGIALLAVLKADKPEVQQYRYEAFHDLVELIRDILCSWRQR
jgi:hypothetical protein